MLYNFNYMMFWKRKHHGDIEKIIGCQVFKGCTDEKKTKHSGRTTLVPDVDSGRIYACCRQGVYGNSELFTSILK